MDVVKQTHIHIKQKNHNFIADYTLTKGL